MFHSYKIFEVELLLTLAKPNSPKHFFSELVKFKPNVLNTKIGIVSTVSSEQPSETVTI